MPSPTPLHRAHVCLVSDHNLPNLVPILEYRPTEVHLLHTPSFAERSRWLEAAVLANHPHCVVHHHALTHESDFAALRASVATFGQSLAGPAFINVTGGTKPMSLALALVLGTQPPGEHLLGYVDLRRDVGGRIEFILPSGRDPKSLRSHVEVPSRLLLHGCTVASYRDYAPDVASRRFALHLHGLDPDARSATIDAMQRFAYRHLHSAIRNDHEVVELRTGLSSQDSESLALGQRVGWWTVDGRRLTRAATDAFRFALGQWLEEWTAFVLFHDDKKPVSHDLTVYRSLEFTTADDAAATRLDAQAPTVGLEVKNELDVAFVHGNRLTLVECKSVRWGANEGDGLESRPAHALYKLDSVRNRLGGHHTGAVLVCTRLPSEHYVERARNQRIDVVVFPETKRLRELVTTPRAQPA